MKLERTFLIENRAGLHARAAAQLVQLATKFQSEVLITKDGETVNGKSIMGVMMLAAVTGSSIIVGIDGDDAEQAMNALADLITRKFDEE